MPQECDDSQLDEIIFNANEHKTSNASKVINLSDSDSGAEQEDEDFEEENADNSTPPINITSNEFIPLLTPKKAPSKSIDIPSASKSSSIKTSNTSIYQIEDDDEKSRRLDMELEKMMLEGEDDLYPPSFEEEAQFTTPIFSQESTEQPDNSECVAKAVASGVVASLFNSPMDQEEILIGGQYKVSEEEKILLSESLLKDMDADDSFLETEDDSFGGLLSEKCTANETTPDTSGHYSADGCDLLKVPCKKRIQLLIPVCG
uniref:Uncharacterized protein n=1 Tax=Ditylenchus dipsaci TaxID=166011 RepID=A0A915DZ88_9BILA